MGGGLKGVGVGEGTDGLGHDRFGRRWGTDSEVGQGKDDCEVGGTEDVRSHAGG